nr:phage portal protein [Corynebacterium auriscanis]
MSWSSEDANVVGRLALKLHRHAVSNRKKWEYYDGAVGIKNLGIAVPEALVNVEAVVGWPEVVVDALAERLEFQGWRSQEDISDLERVFVDNQLDVEVQKAVLDSLVTGVGFLAVSNGGVGEPDVIVNAVPSSRATFEWDERLNRMACGFTRELAADGAVFETLYLPERTVTRVVRDGVAEVTTVAHGLGRCALVALPNRVRADFSRGRSEITRAIRYYTDHGVRTILGMEYNREFYTTPQRYLTNVTPEQLGASEEPTSSELVELGWKVAMNKALIIPPGDPEDGEGEPSAGQFSSAAPTPYIDELKMLAQLVSAQSGVPASYLGFVSDNPTSLMRFGLLRLVW